MNPIFIILIVLGGIFILFCATLYIMYRMAFYQNPKKMEIDLYRHIKNDGRPISVFSKKLVDEIQTVPYTDIYVTSHDGLRLRARLYIKDEKAPFIIAAHGYRSNPWIDFAGGAVLDMELGFNVIMIDERAHGESEGKCISFGYNESKDLLAWIKYIADNYGEEREIILQGMSMGAASVLIASGLPLPPSVKGIMADCPYSSAKEIIKKVISDDMHLPAGICYPMVRLAALVFGKFDPDLADAKEAVKRANVPILIVHGEADSYVPCEMSELVCKYNPEIVRETFPDADHGLSFLYDYDRYKKTAKDFTRKCVSKLNETII